MEINEKFIDFDKYCETCKYKDLEEFKDPCNECLGNPVNMNSDRPVYYEEKED